MIDHLVIATGRVVGTALTVAGWVGTNAVAATVGDPVSAFESTIQWGAIAVMGVLLIVVFCFYLPSLDKRQLEMQEKFLHAAERVQIENARLVKEIETRFDARSERQMAAYDRIAQVMERQQGLCAEAHELMRQFRVECRHEEDT